MKIEVGAKVELDGTEFAVTKLAGKEIRLEAGDPPVVKYRAVRTIERMLDEAAAAALAVAEAAAAAELAETPTASERIAAAREAKEQEAPVAPPAPQPPKRRRSRKAA